MPSSCGHELAGEAGGVLDDDGVNAVALDPVEQLSEAAAVLDGVGTAQAASVNTSTRTKPALLAKASMAARWRLSLSLSAPTLCLP